MTLNSARLHYCSLSTTATATAIAIAMAIAMAIAIAMALTSIGLKATTPVDNAAVHTCLYQDVGHLHCALGQSKRQGVVEECRALSVEDRSLN